MTTMRTNNINDNKDSNDSNDNEHEQQRTSGRQKGTKCLLVGAAVCSTSLLKVLHGTRFQKSLGDQAYPTPPPDCVRDRYSSEDLASSTLHEVLKCLSIGSPDPDLIRHKGRIIGTKMDLIACTNVE